MNKRKIDFQQILAEYKKVGKENVRLTQSALILIQDINPNKTVYTFDIKEASAPVKPAEIRLNINDEFIVNEIGIFLYGRMIDKTDPAPKVINSGMFFTYSPVELSAEMHNNLPFWGGQLKIGVNNIIYIEKWDVLKHLDIPRTQFQRFDAAHFAYENTLPSMKFKEDSMFETDPMIVLSGAKKNEITIALPEAIDIGNGTWITQDAANADYNKTITIDGVCVIFRGLNAQNAAKFQ